MLANEGENLYGIGLGVLWWLVKGVVLMLGVTLVVAVVLLGLLTFVRHLALEREEPRA